MKVTFLGTGTSQGVPMIGCTCEVCRSLDYRDKRLRTSVHLEVGGLSIVIDTGPDFRQQMLREKISHLDALIFTHAHRDHTAGLDDVRAYNFLQKMDMPVFGNGEVLDRLRVDYSYAFGEVSYPGLPRLELKEINNASFSINGVNITPLPVKHLNLPVLGFRVNNFCYITDANYIPDETLEKMQGTDVLVLNALQKAKHVSHFNFDEAIEQAGIIKPRHTYFTHISHNLGLHANTSKELPGNISLAYDGLQIDVE
ncbi:MAG TPA: MBL fold metallo-hydrolase [Cyclobacteriaceae bacterium]|nr:MBL fold metallo-hydrolase [Cyclobacteriaceae bacterium]